MRNTKETAAEQQERALRRRAAKEAAAEQQRRATREAYLAQCKAAAASKAST